MADYRSILDRAISGLPENSEDGRRTIYDKARSALMRQLSSLEPALSPAEISKQRLQLEEAIRDTENRYNGTADLENAVSDAISDLAVDAEAPVVEHTAQKPIAEPIPEPAAEPAPVAEPTPEPIIEQTLPDAKPTQLGTPDRNADEPMAAYVGEENSSAQAAIPTIVPPETIQPERSEATDLSEPASPTLPLATEMSALEPSAELTTPVITPPEMKGQDLIEEAEATLVRVDALHTEKLNALDELKQTMEEDKALDTSVPSVSLNPKKKPTPLDNNDSFVAPEIPYAPEVNPEINIDDTDNAALIEAASKKSSSKGLIWILILLFTFGIGAFSWAQRDSLEPTIRPLYEKIKTNASDLFNSITQTDVPTTQAPDDEAEADVSTKAEDRILDTPLESEQEEPKPTITPEIQPGKRITLPSDTPTSVPKATPSVTPPEAQEPIFTPPNDSANTPEDSTSAPTPEASASEPSQATTTPVTNIFTSSAILYEERKDSGRPDVSTGNVVWELNPTGSEAIGSTGLPSVRGNSRIQNRDLTVRFEIMRNLDESLPASHLIEIEFETGTLFDEDSINNVAGVLMKEKEQDNGQQLAGAVVKVSDTVFWIAMSARAADLASNVDALKKLNWFDIPVIFSSGKRAILTLEKGAGGTKAIEQAFTIWEK